MGTRSRSQSRGNAIMVLAVVVFVLTAWMVIYDRANAESASSPAALSTSEAMSSALALQVEGGDTAIFANYDGIDGESIDANHDKWIDILLVNWGGRVPGPDDSKDSVKSGQAIPEGFVLQMDYDKAAPKLLEKLSTGSVIPRLEVELTTIIGGNQLTYIRYDMHNVRVTSYQVNGEAGAGRPTVVAGHNFEKITVTYTEFDDEGNAKGIVETTWDVSGRG